MISSKETKVVDVNVFSVKTYFEDNGDLTPITNNIDVPFKMERIFIVTANKNQVRGQHAHIDCTQVLICLHGEIQVDLFDGKTNLTYTISRQTAVYIPPGIWATQTYLDTKNVLLVICDKVYDPYDYVRDIKEYIAWKKS